MTHPRALTFWLSACTFLACSAGGSTESNSTAQRPATETASAASGLFPSFTLPDLEGKPLSLDELSGRVVLVVFFATWCPPCVAEVPALNQLWETYQEAGLEVVAVAVDPRESADKIGKFVDQHAVRYTVLLGTRETGRTYQVQGIPTTFLVGRNGQQLQRFVGYTKPEILQQAVVSALGD